MEQQFNTKFSEMSSKLDSVLTQLNRKEVPEKEFDEFGVEIQNPVDIEKLVTEKIVQHETEKQRQIRESGEKYQTEYVSNLRELINEIEDPVIARQVFKKMVEPGGEFNVKFSDNAYADCSKNFIRAIKAAATPFSGKRGASVPIGVDVPSQNTESQKPMPKLDPEAEEYAKSMGMSAEEVSKVLDGDIPLHLRGSKKVF